MCRLLFLSLLLSCGCSTRTTVTSLKTANGSASDSVFKVSFSRGPFSGASFSPKWISIVDSGAPLGLSEDSGMTIDAIKISSTKCDDVACFEQLVSEPIVDSNHVKLLFEPGKIVGNGFALNGTDWTGVSIRESSATLSVADGSGYLSLGRGGALHLFNESGFGADLNVYVADAYAAGQLRADVRLSDQDIGSKKPPPPGTCETRAKMEATACPPAQDKMFREALREAKGRGVDCLRELNPDLAQRLSELDVETINLKCYDDLDSDCCASANRTSNTITINALKIDFDSCVPNTNTLDGNASIMFHEMVHLLGLSHHDNIRKGFYDPTDPVYGCHRACFPHKDYPLSTLESCNACTGAGVSAQVPACIKRACIELGCSTDCFQCAGRVACADDGSTCQVCDGVEKLLPRGWTCDVCKRPSDYNYCGCNGALYVGQAACEKDCCSATQCLACYQTYCVPPDCKYR